VKRGAEKTRERGLRQESMKILQEAARTLMKNQISYQKEEDSGTLRLPAEINFITMNNRTVA
jgi:hypothetical protein